MTNPYIITTNGAKPYRPSPSANPRASKPSTRLVPSGEIKAVNNLASINNPQAYL